ncbi:hypothetical protein KBX18_05060 [Corynebacterium sp. CCUG 69979]|uniref:hypothetical protein n=1 Tax=unclassified Corynebacterium TaxID=2624378 RepID=UPI00210B1009|nr:MULTISPECIES: hypothetical protein [unclassified Corynebacterium]MCQ4623345.1 hypothetical protein [Corynebacterium sp. CCUG 70398]MCQ4624932.1 hypothetical protein [Corynebacterium sp. CCUG 69979]
MPLSSTSPTSAIFKTFLGYRDTLAGYEEITEQGKIGVPSKVIDGTNVEFFDEV